MRKLIALLLAFSLLLVGCGAKTATVSYTFEDLSIQLPSDFIDLSGDEFAEGTTFFYGWDPIAVNGIREDKDTLASYGLTLTLEYFTLLIRTANNISSPVQQKDGVQYFTYESSDYTYVVSVWETEDAFWTVQAYCPTENYPEVSNDIWNILRSVNI